MIPLTVRSGLTGSSAEPAGASVPPGAHLGDAPAHAPLMISLRGVKHAYPSAQGPIPALRGVDLSVQRGEVFGIIGRSGAGKSSLVRIISLLNRPQSGEVRVDGKDLFALEGAQLRQARRRIGLIFQNFNLLSSRTVFGNVALPLELAGVRPYEIRQRVRTLLDLVGLSELEARYPSQISGGQKQRVGIARALASEPQVLLSDEATSALDPETTRSILALLRRINAELGLTIVLITHQMQVIRELAHRVAVLDEGRVVEEGRVLDVFGQPRHATTRSLLAELLPPRLPEHVLARARRAAACRPAPLALWRAEFGPASSDRPLLTALVRDHGLEVNVLQGQLDELQGRPFGVLALSARGDAERLRAGLAYLREQGVAVQEVAYA